jgi:ATP-dependent helicase/nuclease subunit B
VQARFLLGPAGSGKTFRCLAEVRAALANSPDGDPLVFLAPKQATFQLERQLLADSSLNGYTRLHIFSFERLAQFVFEKLNVAPPKLLNDEGRVMILRALLRRHENELQLFRQSARRPGFAQQLSVLLRELQQYQFTPARLRALAAAKNLHPELQGKMSDLALLLEKYADWLKQHELQDANELLDFATAALRQKTLNSQLSTFNFGGLWLDGFAEMTPQELDLLAAMIPFCQNARLAFCFESEPPSETSWLSIWSPIGKTFQQCRTRLENLPGAKIEIEILPRISGKNRFAENSELMLLEKCWNQTPREHEKLKTKNSKLKIVSCANPEAEAVFAAREILKFVRAGNRFRDCAVLIRNLDGYHQPLASEFRRYGIPFFLDRPESVSHHPLAELTRSALRTVAFDWPHDDWFAALKAGFCSVGEEKIDDLENAALEFGWRGKKWREPLPDENCERLRQIILPPFENFSAQLSKTNFKPDGAQLAKILRELWNDLEVEQTLEQWSAAESNQSSIVNRQSSIHPTVWRQMNLWLENLALAFPTEKLPLRDWLPILEAGLANLAVGVIPPALDQVLIGAIDRSRNPNLKFTLVLGVNESIFPAAPAIPAILTGADRDELQQSDAALGPNLRDQLARERFLGYIACTRASEKLAVTFSRNNAAGKVLNPSPFIAHLQKIFPTLEIEEFQNEIKLENAQHANEIAPLIFGIQNWPELLRIPTLVALNESFQQLREPNPTENLSPALAEKIYGATLQSSVSRLEEFAQCPFKFFVHSGLRAEERKVFELDARERGSFQHEVLKIFHEQLTSEKKRWRDLTPTDARERVGQIAADLAPNYRDGLLRADEQSRFTARVLAEALQNFVETLVMWMRRQYEFDPAVAELDFGFDGSRAPAWEIDLGNKHKLALRGRIDRIDLFHESAERALCVVMDYKSSSKKLDKILVEHGVQLQLLAYLAAVCRWPETEKLFGAKQLIPAGVFYVNLRGQFESGNTRTEALADVAGARNLAYRHSGRFDAGALDKLDSAKAADQFNYRLKIDGGLSANSTEALSRAEFEKLLGGVETQLREMGGRIFSGAAQVDPYRKGKQTPCEFCDYQAACRIDKWTHHYRVLRSADGSLA